MDNAEVASNARTEYDVAGARHRFALFQEVVDSNVTFPHRNPIPSHNLPTLVFQCTPEDRLDPSPWRGHEMWVAREKSNGRPVLEIFNTPRESIFHFSDAVEFVVRKEAITCHPLMHVSDALVERHFLSGVLLFWLVKRGALVFHASVVEIGGKAVAFLAESRSGKSALAAALVHLGCRLLSDDDLVLRKEDGIWQALPGYPTMRLWPDIANLFVNDLDRYALVHPGLTKVFVPVGPAGFGNFQPTAAPLHRVYVPARAKELENLVVAEELRKRSALVHVYPHLVYSNLLPKLDLHQKQFSAAADLVRNVSVRKLEYRSGTDNLRAVAQWIVDDVKRE